MRVAWIKFTCGCVAGLGTDTESPRNQKCQCDHGGTQEAYSMEYTLCPVAVEWLPIRKEIKKEAI